MHLLNTIHLAHQRKQGLCGKYSVWLRCQILAYNAWEGQISVAQALILSALPLQFNTLFTQKHEPLNCINNPEKLQQQHPNRAGWAPSRSNVTPRAGRGTDDGGSSCCCWLRAGPRAQGSSVPGPCSRHGEAWPQLPGPLLMHSLVSPSSWRMNMWLDIFLAEE